MTTARSTTYPPGRSLPVRIAAAVLRGFGRLIVGVAALVGLAALLVGLPWGLAHYIGWPLPDHVPSWDELQAVLLNPMSTQFLLSALACILWPTWAVFVVDVALATVDALRRAPRPDLSSVGPLHALAAALVGGVVLSLLGNRGAPAPAGTPVYALVEQDRPVATAPAPPGHSDPAIVVSAAPDKPTGAIPQAQPGTVTVLPPQDGIYDSLWRIAQRALGKGDRWPELFALNQGVPQPDGHALTTPGLIHPGWVLRLPDPPPAASVSPAPSGSGQGQATGQTGDPFPPSAPQTAPSPAVPSPPPAPPSPPPAPSYPVPSTPPTVASTPRTPAPTAVPTPTGQPATPTATPTASVATSTGAVVGLGTAALITAALFTLRLWRRRWYQPGSGVRSDLTIAPIVRELRLRHDHATLAHDEDGIAIIPPSTPADPHVAGRARAQATAQNTAAEHGQVIGVKDGHPLAWDLASTHGLGLIGPGAAAALRALLIALLAERHRPDAAPVDILIPADDVHTLLGSDTALGGGQPQRLHITADLDAALDAMEAELLTRTRRATAPGAGPSPGTLVLVATPAPHAERRLQAILDNGSTLGLAGVLIGQWRPGATARVRAEGTISAASPGLGDALTGTQLFTLPTTDTTDLLDLLHDADAPAEDSERVRRELVAVPDATDDPPQPPPTPVNAGTADVDTQLPRSTTESEYFTPSHSQTGARPEQASPSAPALRVLTALPEATTAPQPELANAHPAAPPSAVSVADPPVNLQITPAEPAELTHDLDEPDALKQADRPGIALSLTVLGRLRLVHHDSGDRDVITTLAPKQREILVYLALHPDGARREALAAAIWPDAPTEAPYNSFHATLSQMRRALTTATQATLKDVTVHHDGHYALNSDLLSVDLWRLDHALTQWRHASSDAHRLAALRRVSKLYHGDLAESMTAEWVEAPREDLRRRVLDALAVLVRSLGEDDPDSTLTVLEQARLLDQHNEAIYRDIIRVQARLGRHEAIPRTLALLTTTLAELDQRPTRDTVALCEFLRRPPPAGRDRRAGS